MHKPLLKEEPTSPNKYKRQKKYFCNLKRKMTAFKNMQIQLTQISNRNELIENTVKELEKLDQSLEKLKSEHRENLNRLEILKEEYFKTLRRKWMQKNSIKSNYLLLHTLNYML
ncbi:MAG: hypothetical protein IPI90_10435 [Saprospiraceae bacterium]|nr:hypothetical protein [Candidatus Vicinibacter affinis]